MRPKGERFLQKVCNLPNLSEGGIIFASIIQHGRRRHLPTAVRGFPQNLLTF